MLVVPTGKINQTIELVQVLKKAKTILFSILGVFRGNILTEHYTIKKPKVPAINKLYVVQKQSIGGF